MWNDYSWSVFEYLQHCDEKNSKPTVSRLSAKALDWTVLYNYLIKTFKTLKK